MKNKIKEKRQNLGLSQADLALKVNVSKMQISNLERCLHSPRLELAINLAKALKTNIYELFYINFIE